MIRRPPRSTLDRSSAASDVYKRQELIVRNFETRIVVRNKKKVNLTAPNLEIIEAQVTNPESLKEICKDFDVVISTVGTVSYTHLRAHETVLDIVCRLLLEKKKKDIDIAPQIA